MVGGINVPKLTHPVNPQLEDLRILHGLTRKGSPASARTIMRAHIPVTANGDLAEKRKTVREVAELFGISPNTANQVRKMHSLEGLDAALKGKARPDPPRAPKAAGDFEAHVIAAALSPAPNGRARWTLRLLAEHCEAFFWEIIVFCGME
jgi:hypothetical protein